MNPDFYLDSDYNGFNSGNSQQMSFYMEPPQQQQQQQRQQPTASQIMMQQHQTYLSLPAHYINQPGAFEDPSLSSNPPLSVPGHHTSFSPAVRPVHGAHMMNNTLDPSPQMFWSESPQQSSPLYAGMPVYSQTAQHNPNNNFVGAHTYGSSSPYSLADSARLVQNSESPVAVGRNSIVRNGSSPLAPSPAGVVHPGPLPTAYSSVMPAPLVPTGTPLIERLEKVKKRACEACNLSKVKCDFGVPCGTLLRNTYARSGMLITTLPGKCASRKVTCVYPTSRKPNRKTTISSSPLSPETNDTARPTLISPDFHVKEIQPMSMSTQEACQANGILSSPTSLVMPAALMANAITPNQQQTDASQPFSLVLPDGLSQSFGVHMSSAQSQVSHFDLSLSIWKALTGRSVLSEIRHILHSMLMC